MSESDRASVQTAEEGQDGDGRGLKEAEGSPNTAHKSVVSRAAMGGGNVKPTHTADSRRCASEGDRGDRCQHGR